MILKLSNKENTYTFTIDDLNNGEKLYYKFQIPASDVVDGKYNMVLMDDDGNIITEEQVCMGYFNAETIQYNRGENVYINSPLNANLEDVRTITIDVPNYTIYPSEGYDAMKEVVVDAQPVYDNGYNDGETDQKAKLTGITITENGTYSREDGYNEVVVDVPDLNGDYNEGYDAGKVDGYDSGYTAGIDYASENAGEIAAINAIDLVATEFGTYYTKYSDNIVYSEVTGVFPDGENFYNLAKVQNNVYNTGIIPNETTKLEFWFVPDLIKDDQDGDWYSVVIDAEKADNNCFRIRHYHPGGSLEYEFQIGIIRIRTYLKYGVNHIEISYADGFIVNGEKVGDFTSNINNEFDEPFYINGTPLYTPPSRTDDGEFGMIKITTDGITNVIIPTEDGFKNITTGEMLEVVYNEGSYKYIDNAPIVLDNLIKSVDVQPKIDVGKYGIKLGYSSFSKVPPYFNFNNTTDCNDMFSHCGNLQTIPLIDTSNVIYMSYMFSDCGNLQTIPLIDTSNVTDMSYMFSNCNNLQTIPQLNTSNVTNMKGMFTKYGGIQTLTSLPKFNVPNLRDIREFFYYSQVIMNNLTEVGGWENLKCNWNNNGGLICLPNLTYQSCINILNGLYDFTGNGETPTSSQGQLKVHPNFLTTVGDEISIGINKGWTITA